MGYVVYHDTRDPSDMYLVGEVEYKEQYVLLRNVFAESGNFLSQVVCLHPAQGTIRVEDDPNGYYMMKAVA